MTATHQAGCAHDLASARAVGAGLLPSVLLCSFGGAGGHAALAGTIATCQVAAALQSMQGRWSCFPPLVIVACTAVLHQRLDRHMQ